MPSQPEVSSFVEVDFKAQDNNPEHHTDEVSTEALIVRRGQCFSISLKFTDSYNPKTDHLVFTASTGKHPDESKGTKVIFGVPDAVKRSADAKVVWKVEVNKKESSPKTGLIVITITPPADAPIGKYSLHLKKSKQNKELGTFCLLFNPWCPDDSVYMENNEERKEFVMNEDGVIWRGSCRHNFPLHWDYGQFEDDMVEICLHLLKVKPKEFKNLVDDESCLGDPIYISRVISAMVNCQDDDGVLAGRWDGEYEDGFSPMHWSGSYPIMKRWYDSGCKPVKYGQCWVFAGVLCSVMRTLGIPCRVVTNFESAHDCDRNLLIDVWHAGKGVDEIESYDSVWNFHVWVEVWMKRPDLPPGFDGWQVLDATPQELSSGVYCCGPASLTAIRNGLASVDYDVPFVFAEVNADRVDWLIKKDGSKKMLTSDTESVGQNISTKSVGSDERWDITNQYKYKEGSDAERSVFKFAVFLNKSGIRREEEEEEERNSEEAAMDGVATNMISVERVEDTPTTRPKVHLKFDEVSKLMKGQDVKLNLVLNSKSTEPRPLSIDIKVVAKSYSGSAHCNILSEVKEDTLQPGKDLQVPVVVPFSKYWKPMLENDVMRISAIVSDTDDDSEVYLAEDDVVLADPPLELKVINDAQVGEKLFVEMVFTNPVAETLKNCTLTLSGSGLLKDEQDIKLPDLCPKRRIRVNAYFHPYKPKKKTLTVDFNCSVFRDIKACHPVYVKTKSN